MAKMPFNRFFAANVLGALLYVPLMVTAGYAASLRLADHLNQFEHVYWQFEHIGWVIILFGALVVSAWRLLKA